MELFDTYFVYFGQVLAVLGLKMLVVRDGYIEVVNNTTVPRLLIFRTLTPK